MRFILDERYRLRGWQDIPTGLLDTQEKRVQFLAKNGYLLLLRCDGPMRSTRSSCPKPSGRCWTGSWSRVSSAKPALPSC